MSEKGNYESLFQAGSKLIKDRVDLDGCFLPKPGFFERRRLLTALRLLEQAAEVEPPYGAASFFAAKVEERLGHGRENLRWLRRAQTVAPENLIVSIELGAALSRQGLHSEAVDVLSSAARQNPNEPRVQSNLGLSLLMSGDAQGAIRAFERLVALEPGQQTNERLLNLAAEVLGGRKPQPRSEAEIIRSL
jgi:Flp pilus assembly protein TadD